MKGRKVLLDLLASTDTKLILNINQSGVVNGTINVSEHYDELNQSGLFFLGKHILINISNNLKLSLGNYTINLTYFDDELRLSRLPENNLSIYVINNSLWQRLNSLIDLKSNSVAAIVTNNSNFTIAATDIIPIINEINVSPQYTKIHGIPFKIHVNTSDNGAISKVNATFNGIEYTLTFNVSTGLYEINLTAPSVNGIFDIEIKSIDNNNNIGMDNTFFVIDNTPPNITILNNQSEVFENGTALIAFVVDEDITWLGYKLNNLTTVDVNFSDVESTMIGIPILRINDLNVGNFTIVLYANDILNNTGISNPFNFTMNSNNLSQSISSCADDPNVTGTWKLTRDLASAGTCIDIMADNVVFDCDGHKINGNGTGFGILSGAGRRSVTIKNCIVSNFSYGIRFEATRNSLMYNNTVLDIGAFGISAASSDNNAILGNKVSLTKSDGIQLFFSSNITVESNIFENNNYGIRISSSSDNVVRSNIIKNNTYGLWVSNLSLPPTRNNLIFNNFFSNTINARSDTVNYWNTTKTVGANIIGGPFLGGNFWHDYRGVDTNNDGIGDTMIPYNLNGNITIGGDYLPLVYPIQQSISVITPNGGETWITATTKNIRWNSTGVSGNVKIELSRNGGVAYAVLFSDTPNDGSENWLVSEPTTRQALVRISSIYNFSVSDTSNSTFSILVNRPYNFTDKWNMISLPLGVINSAKSVLFPTAVSDAFAFDPVLDYFVENVLRPGRGYWVKFAGNQSINISGTEITNVTINVSQGWNMVGALSNPISVLSIVSEPPSIVDSNYFGYSNGYKIADVLLPGKGYWIKVNQSGKLILFTQNQQPLSMTDLGSFNSLSISDNSNGHQSLYFGTATEVIHTDKTELPPKMAGVFDARYISDKYLETVPFPLTSLANYSIYVQSQSYPLNVSWRMKDNSYISKLIYVSSELTNTILLKESGSLIISDPNVVLLKLTVSPFYVMSVFKTGTGSGTVTGQDINCGSDCSEIYESGTTVSLAAVSSSGSSFSGWSGACTGTGSCVFVMNTDKSVTATFSLVTPTPKIPIE